MMNMPATLETVVGIATPSTSIFATKMSRAFPQTFKAFIKSETFMDTAELPMILKRAAPAL